MKIIFAASLSLLVATPALAAGVSSIHVGLIVTGNFASPLVGSWDSKVAVDGAIYHFVIGGTSGAFYELVSVPLRENLLIAADDVLGAPPDTGRCDLRLSGVIFSLEGTSGNRAHLADSYEMRYSVETVEAVTSSTDFDHCRQVAASYVTAGAPRSLILSKAGDGRLVDATSGVEYTRTR